MEGTALAGRVAIVTGANHGIGEATALALAGLGPSVAVSYLRRKDDAGAPGRDGRDVADAIEATGGQAIALEADLTDPATPQLIFDRAEDTLGPVSILVNNASGWRKDSFLGPTTDRLARPTEAVSAATVDAQLLVDARAGALLIAEFARRHRERDDDWGRIVSLTSGGPSGFPGEVSYGAAKAALDNYTMSAAAELSPMGITANVVYPPVTDTGWITPEVRQAVADSAERIVEPGEVAEVIAWLCTDAARLVTGNVIRLR